MDIEFKYADGKIYLENEEGIVIAEVFLEERGGGLVDITHTFVSPSLRGQGIADKLLLAAYEKIKADGKKAKATCSYAVKWFEKNADKRDILA